MEFLQAAWAHREEIGAWLLAALVASTALVHVFQQGAHAFERYAEKTSTKKDDAVARRLAAAADWAALALDTVASLLPKIGPGGKR